MRPTIGLFAAAALLSSAWALNPRLDLVHRTDRPRLAQSRCEAGSVTLTAAAAGGASMASSTINLVKAIVGAGVLSLPVGIAAFSSSRAALVPSLGLLFGIGAVSAYCFAMVGRACEHAEAQSVPMAAIAMCWRPREAATPAGRLRRDTGLPLRVPGRPRRAVSARLRLRLTRPKRIPHRN